MASVARDRLARVAIEPPARPGCFAIDDPPLVATSELDDRTQAYVLAVRDGFERLEDAVRQLAALLILAAAGSRRYDDHPVRIEATKALAEADDRLRSAVPTPRATHHHYHLLQAATKTRFALEQPWGADKTALRSLGEAADHLRWASGALPGLEIVAIGQGCGCCPPMRSR